MKLRRGWFILLVPLALLSGIAYRSYRTRVEWRSVQKVEAPHVQALSPEQRGRLVYLKYGCSMCHGKNAEKGIANPNSQTKLIPALTYTKEGYSWKELQVRILKGAKYIPPADPKKPLPPYRMPGWQGMMTDQELNDLCAYLFSLMPKKEKEEW